MPQASSAQPQAVPAGPGPGRLCIRDRSGRNVPNPNPNPNLLNQDLREPLSCSHSRQKECSPALVHGEPLLSGFMWTRLWVLFSELRIFMFNLGHLFLFAYS